MFITLVTQQCEQNYVQAEMRLVIQILSEYKKLGVVGDKKYKKEIVQVITIIIIIIKI